MSEQPRSSSLRDAGAEHALDPLAPRAELLHRLHRALEDTADGTAPSGMGRGDDARVSVREEDGSAIRRHHADGKAPHGGHHGIGLRPFAAEGSVATTASAEWVCQGVASRAPSSPEEVHGAPAVLMHVFRRVVRADAGVEPAIEPLETPPLRVKKAWARRVSAFRAGS